MKFKFYISILLLITFFLQAILTSGQTTIKGIVLDKITGEEQIGATVLVLNDSSSSTITDLFGRFQISTNLGFPFTLNVTFIGYENQEILVTNDSLDLTIKLIEDSKIIKGVVVIGQNIDKELQSSPLINERWSLRDLEESASASFYEDLGNGMGVDKTTASLGFTIINTRGFNSTSPVRTLQIIDGVDNQAPGLNFSLGNFLGSSELDVLSVDIISGASSPFYGPNAFNGVISMQTKNPFFQKGLSAIVKVGERNLREAAFRYAASTRNKDSLEVFAFKVNFSFIQADDWPADNYEAITGGKTNETNPGRWDAINTYGDEFYPPYKYDIISWSHPGLGTFHRIGYKEIDLTDYDTKNYKANLALHFRTNPKLDYESPEFIISSSFGSGTTVYQGDNRFSLRDILFLQNRIEFRKSGKWFIRAYTTHEDAGNSYDPYFTALQLQEKAKTNKNWGYDYSVYWKNNIVPKMKQEGYPELIFNTETGLFEQDDEAALAWISENQDLLTSWHALTANETNKENGSDGFYEPGTNRFDIAFNEITSAKSNEEEGGTRFYDKSALYHFQGEHVFETKFIDQITVGGNGRLYTPDSDGTIFYDTAGTKITNWEVGAYVGLNKDFFEDKLQASVTVRVDKNENFNLVATPAASLVWNPKQNNYFRLSFSSAIRNPTLSDQYLFLNVGPATLAGNLTGVENLITEESFKIFINTLNPDDLEFFSLDPVQPEKVKTFEVGYRTTISNSFYIDAGYYYSSYNSFLGYRLGIDSEFTETGFPVLSTLEVYRYAANSSNQVTTQGITIGLNYYFWELYQLSGNYSWNKLNTIIEDPIIPAFNTPEHKFNIGISGRDIKIPIGNTRLNGFGFNVNYKWVEGFLFEGSPQFTGFVPTYDLLDAQINLKVKKINTTFKIGASNLLNNKQFQTYGGPKIGRLAYFSIRYDFYKI